MFRRREPNMPEMNPYQQNGFYQDNQMQRIFYQFEETNRKMRNLNNRLRRIESFLGLRTEDKYDEDLYYNE
jgi:hypothetical protein